MISRWHLIGFATFLIGVCITPVQAQFWGLGLGGEATFQRQLDAMNWNYLNEYRYENAGWNTYHRNLFSSQLFLLNGSAQNIQDELDHHSQIGYRFSDLLSTQTVIDLYQYSGNGVKRIRASQNLRYTPVTRFQVTPQIGFQSEQREQNLDQGLLGRVDLSYSPNIPQSKLRSTISGFGEYVDLTPREHQQLGFDIRGTFNNEDVRLTASAFYHQRLQSSYQPSSFLNRDRNNIIEDYQTDSLFTSIRLQTPVSKNWNLEASGELLNAVRTFQNRNLDSDTSLTLYDSRYTNSQLNSGFALSYQKKRLSFRIGLNYGIGSNKAVLINTSDDADQPASESARLARRREQLQNIFYDYDDFELFARSNWRISNLYRLRLNGSSRILRYNTPETNFDDRDELTITAGMDHEFMFSPRFRFNVDISAEGRHKVFINAERSSENNWRRSLRLSPRVWWSPFDIVIFEQNYLLRANYTTYDFKPDDGTTNDQSSREWGIETNLSLYPHDNFEVNLSHSRYFLLIGQLFWDDFAETPLDTLVTTRYEAELAYTKGDQVVGVGVRAFTKTDFLPAATIQLESSNDGNNQRTVLATGNQTTLQIGPTVRVRWYVDPNNIIEINGWLQWQFNSRDYYTQVEEQFQQALRKRESLNFTRTFPNLSMRINYLF